MSGPCAGQNTYKIDDAQKNKRVAFLDLNDQPTPVARVALTFRVRAVADLPVEEVDPFLAALRRIAAVAGTMMQPPNNLPPAVVLPEKLIHRSTNGAEAEGEEDGDEEEQTEAVEKEEKKESK